MLNLNQKELIIKLWGQGKKQQEIASLIGCSQPSVNLWINRHKTGLSLKSLPRSGRPTLLTKRNLAKLKNKITAEVRAANKNYCSLSTKQLSEIIRREIGKDYTMRHVERIMHKLDFSRITPRPQHIRNDPKKVEEFRQEFKKN
ncbi:transposase [Candidatus Woesearchaeota archaeon]|nr:transposase [Candidatus Woesearchaeota archaeon]